MLAVRSAVPLATARADSRGALRAHARATPAGRLLEQRPPPLLIRSAQPQLRPRRGTAMPTAAILTPNAPAPAAAQNGARPAAVGVHVAIVGAGVAGLQQARALQKRGIAFTVFEAADDVGGVWRSNYEGFGAQVRHAWYELPEFPWPAELRRAAGEGSYPSGGAIQSYLRAYATRFDLLPSVQTRTRVTSVAREPDGAWRVTVAPAGGGGKASATRFTHVVVATGAYGTPFVPPVDGAAAFQGEQLPAAQFTSAARAAAKDVVVVGAGKSALDVAAAAARTARSVTLIARKVHWPLAPFVGGIIPYEFAAYARLAKFGRAYYTAAPPQRLLHALFAPLKWLIWRVVELLLRLQFGLRGPLSPDEPIERDVYYTGQIYPRDDFFRAVRAGKIKVIKGAEVASLSRDGVVTTAGQALPAQLVVWATGHRKDYKWADEWTRARLDLQDDGLYLYRNIAPPLVPNLLFVGGEVTTYNNPLTHALQAEWVAALVAGALALPPAEAQLRDVERLRAWRRSFIPANDARAAKYQLHGNQYHDQLVRDLGHRTLRKPWWTLGAAELLWPTQASDYRQLVAPPAASAR